MGYRGSPGGVFGSRVGDYPSGLRASKHEGRPRSKRQTEKNENGSGRGQQERIFWRSLGLVEDVPGSSGEGPEDGESNGPPR